MIHDVAALLKELKYKAVRSSGAGGQHVNKVASKVELSFDVAQTQALNSIQKIRLRNKLKNRLTKEGILILQCDDSRSQYKNKALVTKRFMHLVKGALKPQKVRVSTKVPKSAIRKRLKGKRLHSEKKESRRKPDV
ncbi:aminoacyl-tRNA hydrolase [Tamlana fucoidanivorans]|uniref:Aminoacyl-tRNA hydrolase n=1 Tax=Allotamlana fucoidanivorans TaxID=2583814 RepID=A0A5C4SJV4_9FLAO|nr:alternative ribosome rescue aminoacyl-tRNA hydrolase ArfB [Tamlana fucoidanivorans]TNJ44197.1 aminoacyl-tRNA hydrolase [Tamlana fucoidanivorans]